METMNRDGRGQVDPGKAIGLVIALSVAGIIGAFLMPVAINELEGDQSVTITQNTSETVEVNAELNATLDSVDDTADTATYTLTADNTSKTVTVDNGTTETVSFDRGDVNVSTTDVSVGEATSEFSYPRDFSYGSGAQSLWGLLGLGMVLALFLLVLGMARDQM